MVGVGTVSFIAFKRRFALFEICPYASKSAFWQTLPQWPVCAGL